MNWFDNLISSGSALAGKWLDSQRPNTPTPAPTPAPATNNTLPVWLAPVGIGLAVLLVLFVVLRKG